MDKDTIIKNILTELNDKKIIVSEAILNLNIDRVIQYILNYCHLKELPQELYGTVEEMVVNQILEAQSNSNGEEVASISEGGRTVSFVTSASKLAEYIKFDNDVRIILNNFKRFYKYD